MPRAARQSPSGCAEKFVHRTTAICAIPSSHVGLLVIIGNPEQGWAVGGRGTLSKEAVRVVKHLAVRGIESGTIVRMRSAQSTVTVHIFRICFILALKIGKDFQVDHIA